MLKNYFITAFRNSVKYKFISFINVSGLAVGITCFILIYSFFQNEISYDTFHSKAKSIYRIYSIGKTPQGIEKTATTPDPLAGALRNDFPLSQAVSISHYIEFPVNVDGKSFKEKICIADPGIFSFFSFPLIKGNPNTALNNPTSVVITEEIARKYFGEDEALGKTITLLNRFPLVISGVLKKVPSNSSLQLNIVVSSGLMKHFFPGYQDQWTSSSRYTFVNCTDKFTAAELKSILPKLREKYAPAFLKENYRTDFNIQPLTYIHTQQDIIGGHVQPVSKLYLYTLLAIALSVLAIACINFTNLTASRSTDRIKEISVRKVLGSKKSQLVFQFLSESVLLSFIALFAAIALAEIFLPEFNLLTGKEIEIFRLTFTDAAGLTLLGLAIGVLSGFYPAFLLSSSGSIKKYKNKATPGSSINIFRKTLMAAQFVISITLITSILVIGSQISFMKNFNLGFSKENILVIPLNDGSGSIESKAQAYINEINKGSRDAGIINTAVSEHTPGYYYNNEFSIIPEGFNKNEAITMIVTSMDENFLDTYKLSLIEGRNFSSEFSLDKSQAVMLSETAMKKIGWTSAAGKSIMFAHGDGPFKVVGVIKDIHFKSLQNKIEPLVIRYPSAGYWQNFLSVKVTSSDVAGTINYLKDQWQKIIPERQFEYFFIDDKYDEAYKTDEKTAQITGIFSFIAITLASLGLLGLTILTITQRTKEIGIRKVLGASIKSIFLLISKQFIKIILVADIIAFPAAYIFMSKWLNDYPYRITLDISFFLLGGVIVLLIALLTISILTIRAAKTNPVESLKYE